MSRSAAELAVQLVSGFGRPDDIVAVLAEDATWWITPTIPPEIMQSVSTGRDVIRGNMQRVFSLLYDGDTMRTEGSQCVRRRPQRCRSLHVDGSIPQRRKVFQ